MCRDRQKVDPRLRDHASWFPPVAETSSRNLGSNFVYHLGTDAMGGRRGVLVAGLEGVHSESRSHNGLEGGARSRALPRVPGGLPESRRGVHLQELVQVTFVMVHLFIVISSCDHDIDLNLQHKDHCVIYIKTDDHNL